MLRRFNKHSSLVLKVILFDVEIVSCTTTVKLPFVLTIHILAKIKIGLLKKTHQSLYAACTLFGLCFGGNFHAV